MTNQNDLYCFECHDTGDVIPCNSCPRAYHSKCLVSPVLSQRDWTCPECEISQSSFFLINHSTPLERHSVNEFSQMLQYALTRLKSHSQIKYFIESMKTSDYLDHIIHPMDFEILEKNIHRNKYRSTDAFINDMKWIVHNSVIYNGNQSKLTSISRTLLKMARHETTEIELCSECYLRGTQVFEKDWFTKPCSIPHTLCWAKMKGYQPWPAKVLRIVNDEVDVRFFGKHDRAWVSHNNCFVLSKEYPGSEKKKSNSNLDTSLIELKIHIDQLKQLYGHFSYAPPQTLLSKTKPFKFVSIIDDSMLPAYITVTNYRYCSTSKNSTSSISNRTKVTDDHLENLRENQQVAKRRRISSNYTNPNLSSTDDYELETTLNVFDILNQSDQPSNSCTTDNEITFIPSKIRCISPTDNKIRIQALLRKYLHCKSPTIDPVTSDVQSSMDELLDSVDVLPINNQLSEQTKPKKSWKSHAQDCNIPKPIPPKFTTCLSLDQSFSSSLPFVPLRPLSVSPPHETNFEQISSETTNSVSIQPKKPLTRTPSVEIIDTQSEPVNQQNHQIAPSSLSLNTDISLPTIIPTNPFVSQPFKTIPPIYPTTSRIKTTTNKRVESSKHCARTLSNSILQKQSNSTWQSHHTSNTRFISNLNSMQETQSTNEIQLVINNFNDQFQQLLVDVTGKIEISLQTTRIQYEKNLEELNRSYRLSLDELHSMTNEQMQQIHTNLELQYWKRLSDMHNRYESKLQYE